MVEVSVEGKEWAKAAAWLGDLVRASVVEASIEGKEWAQVVAWLVARALAVVLEEEEVSAPAA